jgi:hypothetical protein
MFDNLSTAVHTANEDDLLSAFETDETSTSSKKTKTDDTKTKDSKTKDQSKPTSKKTSSSKDNTGLTPKKDIITDLSTDDDDEIFDTDDENTDEDEDADEDADQQDVEKKKDAKKKVVKKEEDTDDDDDNDNTTDDEDTNDESTDDDNDEDSDDEKGGVETDEDVKDFLQKRGELLIEKGEWVDFEGREDFEWTEENFAQLEIDQRKFQKEQMVEEILNSFGPTGREIAQYTQNGGNPDDLIDIFKEQQRVENLTVDTEEAQKAVVLKYETEFLGKKPERVKKYIDSLIADKELKDVATEAKEAMEASLTEQATTLQAEQEAVVKERQQKQKAEINRFSNEASAIINGDKTIAASEKALLLKVLTKFDKRLPNGTPVNEFYNRFAEFKKDLPNYIKLVRFVMDPEKFAKGLKNEGKTAAVEQSFKLARSSQKSKKVKSTDSLNNKGKVGKTKFQLL